MIRVYLFLFVTFQLFVSACLAQIDSSKYSTSYQSEINVCPSCVKHLIVTDTSGFRNIVSEAVNLESITLRNTSIISFPQYLAHFPSLKDLNIEGVVSLPKNTEILTHLENVDVLDCYNLNFTDFFASCKPLKNVRIFMSDSLIIPTIPAKYIIVRELNKTWSLNKSIDIGQCEYLTILMSDFTILDNFINTEKVKRMDISGCCYVNIGEEFYQQFLNLYDIKLDRSRYHKDNRCIAGPKGHPSNR